jgi:hypothetical protein
MTRHAMLAILLLLFSALAVLADEETRDEPEANPGRPTVATPATLTPVGYLQFETGYLGASQSPEFSTSHGANEIAKLTVHPRLQLLLSVQPVAHYRTAGGSGTGFSDISVGAQAVVLKGKNTRPTVAVGYFRDIHGGNVPDYDFGSSTNSLLLLASADVKRFHYDANGFFNEARAGSVARLQYGQAVSVSHPLGKKVTVMGEIWTFTQPFLQGNAVGNLWGVSYSVRKNLVLDAAVNHGLTSTSTQWEGFAGFTYVLPHKLW